MLDVGARPTGIYDRRRLDERSEGNLDAVTVAVSLQRPAPVIVLNAAAIPERND